MEKLKFAVIGGGSSYTPEFVDGLIRRTESLPLEEIALVDVADGQDKLKINQALTQRMFDRAGLDVKVSATLDRREALKGASYVITQFRVGGLAARSLDEKIPLEFNVIGQETTGPGGFAKALRTVPVALSIAKDMEELCPDAWLINFTNPSGIVTEALRTHSSVRSIGLCNGPLNMERHLAKLLEVAPEDVYCEFVGLNHLSYIKKVYVKGEDKTDELFTKSIFEESILKNIPPVPGGKELIQTLRLIPSSYLSYFYFENFMLEKELASVREGKGTRADQVMKVEKELFELYANPELNEKPAQLSQRGGALYSEVALSLIESIQHNLGRVHVVNSVNQGAISSLPHGAVVETNCVVNSTGAHPIASGELPVSIRSFVAQVKTYEQLTIEAAISGNRDIAFLALLNNPLVHGADVAKNLLEKLLEAHKKHLPRFFPQEV